MGEAAYRDVQLRKRSKLLCFLKYWRCVTTSGIGSLNQSVGHSTQASPRGIALSQPQEILQTCNSATINCWQLSFFLSRHQWIDEVPRRGRAAKLYNRMWGEDFSKSESLCVMQRIQFSMGSNLHHSVVPIERQAACILDADSRHSLE